MDPYSLLLALAGAAAVLACVLGILTRLDLHRARLVQWPPLLGGAAILLAVVAGAYHLLSGHGPGSADPLEPIGFIPEHPELIAIVAVALLGLGIAKRN